MVFDTSAICAYFNSMVIEGERVKLTQLSDQDFLVTYEWFTKSDPCRQTCRPITQLDPHSALDRFRLRLKMKELQSFAVRRKSDNALLGRVTYFDVNVRNRSAEIGYLLGPEYRKQGYMADALYALLDYLFNELGLNKVIAQTAEFNQPSVSLLENFGFKQDGRLRKHHEFRGKLYDDLVYSMLAEEFNYEE